MDERTAEMLALLPPIGEAWPDMEDGALREIHLRRGAPVLLMMDGGEWLSARTVDEVWLDRAVDALAAHSLYARDEELRQGYLSLPDGCRAGVCGCVVPEDGRIGRMTSISSVCIRLARAVKGCADPAMPWLYDAGRPLSALILSPPGLGKTTLLRDMARQFSNGTEWGKGQNVAIADERGELAASGHLDVGPRTDVMTNCPKAAAIPLMVRAMAPAVIATDELGGAADAQAVLEAVRCGVAVLATAHAVSLMHARARAALRPLMESGVFERVILLEGRPGRIGAICDGQRQILYDGEETT